MSQTFPNPKLAVTDSKMIGKDSIEPAPSDTDALTRALQRSFQATVEEAIPDSLLDLISKLT